MKIKVNVIRMIIDHAIQDSPVEACGYLAGNGAVITDAVPLRNVDSSTEHYSLDPQEQFTAVRNLRKKNLRVMAVYHSHPDSPARMSEEDIRLAFDPDISYVIVSLDGNTCVKSFRVKNAIVTEETLDHV
jgi:proteasome lid subunit RPN8/RPN11